MAGAETIVGVLIESLRLALLILAPVMAAVLAAALVTGLLQALLRLEDPVIGFAARGFAVVLALFLAGRWMMDRMLDFTVRLWSAW